MSNPADKFYNLLYFILNFNHFFSKNGLTHLFICSYKSVYLKAQIVAENGA